MTNGPAPAEGQDLTSAFRVFHGGAEWSFSTGTLVRRFRRDDADWLLIVPAQGDAYLIDPCQCLVALDPGFNAAPFKV